MTNGREAAANWSLKEDVRDYWSRRAESFDREPGHRIPPGPERNAWRAMLARHLGPEPLDVLELACGTGEVTGVLLDAGHRVTGIDFSEAMIARAREKHGGHPRARFLLRDAESTLEPDGFYDAVVCRHLVWTLTDPDAALRDWRRVLKPGGRLLVFDGDFVRLPWRGRLARKGIAAIERWSGSSPRRDPDLLGQHARILQAVPFADGLSFETLRPLAEAAGFGAVRNVGHGSISRA